MSRPPKRFNTPLQRMIVNARAIVFWLYLHLPKPLRRVKSWNFCESKRNEVDDALRKQLVQLQTIADNTKPKADPFAQ